MDHLKRDCKAAYTKPQNEPFFQLLTVGARLQFPEQYSSNPIKQLMLMGAGVFATAMSPSPKISN
jgi:hypothetical protein